MAVTSMRTRWKQERTRISKLQGQETEKWQDKEIERQRNNKIERWKVLYEMHMVVFSTQIQEKKRFNNEKKSVLSKQHH